MVSRLLVIEGPDAGTYGETFSATFDDGHLSLNRWEDVLDERHVRVHVRAATPEDLTVAFIRAREDDGSAARARAILDRCGTGAPMDVAVRGGVCGVLATLGLSAILTPTAEDGGDQ